MADGVIDLDSAPERRMVSSPCEWSGLEVPGGDVFEDDRDGVWRAECRRCDRRVPVDIFGGVVHEVEGKTTQTFDVDHPMRVRFRVHKRFEQAVVVPAGG